LQNLFNGVNLALHYREFHRASREHRDVYFFILSVETVRKDKTHSLHQNVYYFILLA
jgi:hypothetical protein